MHDKFGVKEFLNTSPDLNLGEHQLQTTSNNEHQA